MIFCESCNNGIILDLLFWLCVQADKTSKDVKSAVVTSFIFPPNEQLGLYIQDKRQFFRAFLAFWPETPLLTAFHGTITCHICKQKASPKAKLYLVKLRHSPKQPIWAYMKQYMKTMVSVSLLAIFALITACTAKPVVEREPSSTYGRAKLGEAYFFVVNSLNEAQVRLRKYDLTKSEDLASLERDLQQFLVEFKKRKDGKTPDIEQNVVALDIKQPFSKFKLTDGNLKDSAEYMLELYARVRRRDISNHEATYQLAQVARALNLMYTEPVKGKYEFFTFPVHVARFLSSPSVSENYKGQDPDLKFLRDEVVQEKDIAKIDLAHDFNFKDIKSSCQYEKAKRGYGVHSGFHIKCGEHSYKMKFGNEEYSGPLNSRIYRSLGFIAPHINYYETLNVDYDRRVILEFNERLVMSFKLTFIAIPVYKKVKKEFINPFSWMKGVKLKDGTFVDAKTAQARLITRSIEENITADMIDANFESQIDQFVFGSSSLTLKDDPVTGDELGPWIPDDFNYRDFKEIRGIMVLAAWTGNYDVRKDNLRLVAVPDSKGKKQLRLAFGDAGSGLGHATGISRKGSSVDTMEWEVSSVYEDMNQNDDRWPQDKAQQRISLSGIGNLEHAKAFSKIKLSDAQWMLRKLCQYSSNQIKSALVASGLSSAEVVLGHAKLLERRNKMLEHFKMDEEFKLSCHVPVNRNMNYDPLKDPLVTISYDKNAKAIAAPDRGHRVVNGKLIVPVTQVP